MPVENPYKPPAAAVRDPPPAPRSPIVAVLAGLGIDVGGSIVSGIVLGIVYAVMLAAGGMSPQQIQTTLTQPDPSSGFFIFGTVVGYAFSTLAGYVCARLVRSRERRVTGIMAAISGAIGLAMIVASSVGLSLGIALTVIQVACVMLGGELGRRRNIGDLRKANAATAA